VIRQQKSQKVLKHFYWERLGRSERRDLAALLSSLEDSFESHQARLRNSDKSTSKTVQVKKRLTPSFENLDIAGKDQSEGPSTDESLHERQNKGAKTAKADENPPSTSSQVEETRLGRLIKSLS
jgi:hypothetical protein